MPAVAHLRSMAPPRKRVLEVGVDVIGSDELVKRIGEWQAASTQAPNRRWISDSIAGDRRSRRRMARGRTSGRPLAWTRVVKRRGDTCC
jgi:hypothetical protein